MAALIRLPRARWRTPPTSGFDLDPGHWLVEKGIELYAPLCDRSSFFYRRAPVSPLTDSIARAPSPGSTWAVGTVNSTYANLELSGSPLPFPFTLLAWGKAPATGTDARIAISVSRNTNANPGYHALRWTGSSSTPSYRIAAASFDSTNTYQSSFDATYTDSWILGLALFRSNTYRLAGQNGVFASSSSTNSVARGTVSQNVDIGARYHSSAFGLNFNGSLFNVLALPYEMSAADFARLYREQKENPWGLLRPRAVRFIFIPSAGGGGSTYNLVGAINSLSSTPDAVVLSVTRALSTELVSDTLTPSAAFLVQRALSTALSSSSSAPDTVTLGVTGLLALTTALASQSTTADASVNVVRTLSTALSSESVASDTVTLNTSTVIALVTAVASGSLTPDAALSVARALSTALNSDSTTSGAAIAVLRQLATAIASASAVSAPNLLLGGDTIIAIQSLIASQSLTPDRVRLLTALVTEIETALHLCATVTKPSMIGVGQPASMVATVHPTAITATEISTN